MPKKYNLDIRGCDVKVMSRLWFGPWHNIMHGVYTMDGGLLGLFDTYAKVLDFVLGARHRVLNMSDVLLRAVEENQRDRELMAFLRQSGFQVESAWMADRNTETISPHPSVFCYTTAEAFLEENR